MTGTPERTLLLVDDEENILRALTRLLRRDGYRILTARSGAEGLRLLGQNPGVGVVISDQRMPEMMGSEFLGVVKQRHPETVRIMLSGYTELKSVSGAMDEGAIDKFLTKPWDDERLRADVREAFNRHALGGDHPRPAAQTLSGQPVTAVPILARREPAGREDVIDAAQEILEYLPVGVLGLDDDGLIAAANQRAHQLLGAADTSLPGRRAQEVLPGELMTMFVSTEMGGEHIRRGVQVNGRRFDVHLARCRFCRTSHGRLLVLVPEGGP